MRRDAFTHGLWQFRAGTGNFAWAGIDMALWDICGRACDQPLWRLLGGLQEPEPTYFYYLARGSRESPRRRRSPTALDARVRRLLPQGRARRRGGSRDGRADARSARRRAAAPRRRERQLDASAGASACCGALEELEIDFVEQPVRDHPIEHLAELRSRTDDRRLRKRRALVGGRGVRAHPRSAGGRLLLLAVLGRVASPAFHGLRGSPSTRACRSASTPTASSASPPPRRTTSC